MKKILALLLALCMVFALSAAAFAAENTAIVGERTVAVRTGESSVKRKTVKLCLIKVSREAA